VILMRYIVALFLITALLVSCSSPPKDVPSADIKEKTPPPETIPDVSSTPPFPPVDTPPDGDAVPLDKAKSSFEFEGFGPGKSHIGTFEDMDGVLIVRDGVIVGASGAIQSGSVNTGIDGLDKHLKNEDFFDVALYPEISFYGEISDGMLTGPLTFHGVTHTVSYPVEVGDNSVSADFLLDTTPFNIKYIGINKDVRITFTAAS
ncbi:MAG: YceI family protein, partial [Nanoarchaeota archaeon]